MSLLSALKSKISGNYKSQIDGISEPIIKSDTNKDNCNGPHLYHASMFGYLDDVMKYINAGFSPNYREQFTNKTALHAAAIGNNVEVIDALIAAGFDMDAADKTGQCPLHDAAIHGCNEASLRLIDSGANIEAKDNQGSTPLRNAVINKSINVIPLLLHANAIIDDSIMDLVEPNSEVHKVIAEQISKKAIQSAIDNSKLDNEIVKSKSRAL